MPRPEGPHLRRTWPQRLLIACNAVALVAAAVTAGALAYSNDRLAEIERVGLSDVTRAEELAKGDAQNYLIVGVDEAGGGGQGESAGLHTDTIMILRIDPQDTSAQLVSFPRDLWVPIAETDANQRINTALSTGGARRLIKTIDEDFGIPVHHYLQVDFEDFRTLVEVVDGIPVQFPRPARAPSSGLSIPEAGCFTLGPDQALGFSRARKDYQVQDADGTWHTDLGGDYSRVERQQLFVELALRQVITKGARNPNTLRRLVDLGVGTIRVDDALDGDNLVDLGARFRDFRPEELVTHTLPTTEDNVGEADVLFLREDDAEPILSIFRGVDPSRPGSVSPPDVTVQVRNGTATPGQAAEVTTTLTDAGFEALVPDDAEQGQPTTILYPAGREAQAQLVARHLSGPVDYEVSPSIDDADVVVVTGSDWDGVVSTPRPADEVEAPVTTSPATTTEADASGSSTTVESDDDGPAGDQGDADDPDDPRFYRAEAPPAGASCEATG